MQESVGPMPPTPTKPIRTLALRLALRALLLSPDASFNERAAFAHDLPKLLGRLVKRAAARMTHTWTRWSVPATARTWDLRPTRGDHAAVQTNSSATDAVSPCPTQKRRPIREHSSRPSTSAPFLDGTSFPRKRCAWTHGTGPKPHARGSLDLNPFALRDPHDRAPSRSRRLPTIRKRTSRSSPRTRFATRRSAPARTRHALVAAAANTRNAADVGDTLRVLQRSAACGAL